MIKNCCVGYTYNPESTEGSTPGRTGVLKIAFFGLTNESVEVTVEHPVLFDVTKKIVGRPLT